MPPPIIPFFHTSTDMTEITIGNRSYVILGQEFLSAIIGTRRDRFVLTALALLDGAKSSEPGKLGGGVIAIEAIIVNRPRRNCRYTALHLRPRVSQIRRLQGYCRSRNPVIEARSVIPLLYRFVPLHGHVLIALAARFEIWSDEKYPVPRTCL